MADAYIVDALRTPTGRRGGGLSGIHPADLGAHVLRTIVDRNDIDPLAVEDVFFGCVDAIGPQAGDIARTCWLAAGLPEEVPGTTIDRPCGSSQPAVHFAPPAGMAGASDVGRARRGENQARTSLPTAAARGPGVGVADPLLR